MSSKDRYARGKEAVLDALDGITLSHERLEYAREFLDSVPAYEPAQEEDEPGLRVGVMVWDKTHDGSTRVLEREAYSVHDTRDLQDLPLMGYKLGKKVLDGMILHHIGRLRSEDAGRRAQERDKEKG